MLSAAWHVVIAAWAAAVESRGTTTLGILASVLVLTVVNIVKARGPKSWWKSLSIRDVFTTAGVAGSVWVILVIYQAMVIIYNDHKSLVQRNQELNGQINTVQPEETRDPDGFYQFGQKVASVSGAQIDLPKSQVTFTKVLVNSSANTSKTFEYRDWIINCDWNGKHLPDTSPPPNTVVGVVLGPAVAMGYWPCSIVSKRK
jgi:hypothetical protein